MNMLVNQGREAVSEELKEEMGLRWERFNKLHTRHMNTPIWDTPERRKLNAELKAAKEEYFKAYEMADPGTRCM